MSFHKRRVSCEVSVGSVRLGGGRPVVVQSMTDTPTADADKTVQQTLALIEAGSEMVRWTINDDQAARGAVQAVKRLRSLGISVPIIGDFHFNGHTLLTAHPELAGCLDKYRINPGNAKQAGSSRDPFDVMIGVAIASQKAVRIGVNWGSIDKDLFSSLMERNAASSSPKSAREVMLEAMVESALSNAQRALRQGLPREKLVVSAKLSVLQDTVEVYERLAKACDYALHLGLTEAGGGVKGIAASASALAILLQQGIGDTLRVSLTPQPGQPRTQEVEVCREILQSMGFRYFAPSITSCPGCGRTNSSYFQELAGAVREHVKANMPIWRTRYPGVEQLKIAVMGCVVNGPGESRHADIGISLPGAFEEPAAPVFIDGEKVCVLKGDNISGEFLVLLENYISRRFGSGN